LTKRKTKSEIEEWLNSINLEDIDAIEVDPADSFTGYYIRAYGKGKVKDVFTIHLSGSDFKDYERAFAMVEKALVARGYEFDGEKFVKSPRKE
jgi:hypothetical protein